MTAVAPRLFPSTAARCALALTAVCGPPAALAQTALPPGVGVYLANSVIGIGEASYASSGTVTIYSGGGLLVSTPAFGDTYALTSPAAMPLGLTTATLSSIGSNVPAGYHATGTASATADLAGGVLRGTTGSVADVPYERVGPVSARVVTTSLMQDDVTFAVASAQGADVVVSAHLDGSYALGDPIYGGGTADMVVSFGGSFSYYGREDSAGQSGYHGAVLGDFSSYMFSNETATGFDFTGTLHVTDGERVRSTTALYLDCSYAACAFGNTARIGLTVPTGVSFTSDSGVFLTAVGPPVSAVPEPTTPSLLAAGLGVLALIKVQASRRRRRMQAVHFV